MSSEEEDTHRRTTHSNYFQTNFTVLVKEARDVDRSFPGAGADDDRKKVSISIQTGNRNSVEGEESPKERKRWVRPPLVGQASSGSDSQLSIVHVLDNDSDEDDVVQSSHEAYLSTAGYPNRKDYISEKPPEGSAAIVPENRVPSPASASSLTSGRPLEWDSGADVGYFKPYNDGNGADKLSSIERMALGGSASLLTRSDPEGTVSTTAAPPPPPAFPSSSGHNQTLSHSTVGPPNAESTPNLSSSKSSRSSRASEKVVSHIFPEVVVRENAQPSDSENESRAPPYDTPKPEDLPKRSSSLEDVGAANQQPAPFVRSQSQNNINFDMNAHLLKIVQPQSNSSSSVATVVKGSAKTQSTDKKESESGSGPDGRANSFEYLPGAAFEQASRNDPTSFDPLKTDIDRGVRILSDFVKGTNANNTALKKKLLRKVVDELLAKKYPGEEEWSSGSATGQASESWLDGNQPLPNAPSTWQGLPSVPEGGDKFVKSWPVSSWPLELGNERCVTRRGNGMEPERSEISGESESQGSLLARMDKAGQPSGTSKSSSSSSSVVESSIKQHTQPLPGFRKRSSEPNHVGKEKSVQSSSTSRSDWKAPATKSEMVYEQRKQKAVDPGILRYLHCERENQLDWIKKEIDHLSNLKKLLEMHESLRKNFDHLKKSKSDRKERAQSADPKFARHKKKPAHISKSEPLKFSVPKEEVSDNGWESHDYGNKVKGILKKNASTNTLLSEGERHCGITKRPISYTIIFDPKDKENVGGSFAVRPALSNPSSKTSGVTIADRETLMKESRERIHALFNTNNLQEELMQKKPDYVARAEMRRQTVAELAAIREVRERNRNKILAAAINGEPAPPIPIPLAVKRVVSQKSMRKLTERNYRKSSFVKQQQLERKKREERVTNRIMAEMFNRNLQRRILKGETYLSNSVNVL